MRPALFVRHKISGRPSESPTYCSTPAATNYRTSSRPHLVRVRELGRVGTLQSAHLPVLILRRYAPVQLEELMSPRTSSFGLKRPGSSPCGNRRRPAPCTLPSSHDVIAFGDESANTFEIEIGKRFAEIGHEFYDRCAAFLWLMHWVVKEYIGRGQFVYDSWIPRISPKFLKPPVYNYLVFLCHHIVPVGCMLAVNRPNELRTTRFPNCLR
jgi:hypothetical protein